MRRRQVAQNAAALARPPRVEQEEVEPYTIEEVRLIFQAAEERRNAARWAVALALGLRQGEVLGLHWPDVDLDDGIIRIRSSRLRPEYEHGCEVPCGKKPGWCPERVQITDDDGLPKSKAGRRRVGLPPALVELLIAHRKEQDRERAIAGSMWSETGRVFTDQLGRAIKPNSDYHAWKALLKRAGVRDARLHDARHTAATVLLVLGVPERTVMGIMGWSSTGMAARYQHVSDPIRRSVARLVDGLIWAVGRAELRPDLRPRAGSAARRMADKAALFLVCKGGGCGIRTREGVNPTRFPTPHWPIRNRPCASI